MSSQLPADIAAKLADLYARMVEAYDRVAKQLDFTCEGCPDNCCDSFFHHHTYVEWAYLWEGVHGLPEEQQQELVARAERHVEASETAMGRGERPQVMCPLNDHGLCSLYRHRLMICRMHGVPSSLTRPDGKTLHFPGCFRCQELTVGRNDLPVVDRTSFYRELVDLEIAFLGPRRHILPKVSMTLARMLTAGPPTL
ncbi:MAG: hypothetical protein OEV91_00710 [Desulfobulbaceae bacterium]|nr:hypothetical protein [Desulfobulbaceae bacterium]